MSKDPQNTTQREGFRGRHLFYALMGGATVGAITALLTAPASGAELRDKLRASGQKGRDKVRHLPEAIRSATVAAEEAFVAALEEHPVAKKPEALTSRHREPSHRHSVS